MNVLKRLLSFRLSIIELTLLAFITGLHFNVNAMADKKVDLIQTQNINAQWQYLEQDINFERAKNAKGWSTINIPHTWNAIDTVDSNPGYRRSASWYKRTLQTTSIKNSLTFLYFEGVNYETTVYVNNQKVGQHIGGYLGFEFDISRYLKPNGINEVMVNVSNRYNPNLIPSQKADFFLYGGITRDVWLIQRPAQYVSQVTVNTPDVSKLKALTNIDITFNESLNNGDFSLVSTLISPNDKIVETKQQTVNDIQKINVNFSALPQPALWSIDTPNLYTAQIALYKNNTLLQTKNVTFGYRWFEMKPHQGFFLNGERVLIRGTHRHEEHAGLGNALSNEQHYKDMQQIKDMGANFVRLGHYPQDPEVYKAANELGLIIWDELPWCRGGKGGAEWEANTERMLRQQITQNINHPSILFWSLGNEIYWEEDFPGGGAEAVVMPYLTKLNSITKQLDPTRLTSIRKYYPGADLVDAFSPSIWAGWYGGAYNQYEEALTKSMKKYPAFLHMEYGGSSHVGRHTETPISASGIRDAQISVEEAMNQAIVKSVAKDSDWNENYIVDLFDWHLMVSESLPGFGGNAQWAFKDFGTPLRPENPIPYINQKGLVDREGNPKDAYYVFKSVWATEPFCYIESKTWTHRNGPAEGRDVAVYCNTPEAELFLNGQSLGKKTKDAKQFPAGGLVWKVPFKAGDNQLKALGYTSTNKTVVDETQVNYLIGEHGKYHHIDLSAKTLANGHILITAVAQDQNNNRVLNYNERVYFSNMDGHGQLLENYGTPTKSSTIEMASGTASIEFIPGSQATTIEFRTQNIKGVYINIPAQ
ncbi:glycoside hydrolase family 2 protein [Algibacillus agarilyticus]|uniref:glycoside hydrolase family 2 protein n=1 Tax=Algibacillus agarilyticus TaxID=2234133 RepID=UPI000DCFC782|nr:glycoside hydrolase family 2 TIM barrel-domain containing protein [Algibacillus agarilyticus]